jgi:hypothetical protein
MSPFLWAAITRLNRALFLLRQICYQMLPMSTSAGMLRYVVFWTTNLSL